MKVIGICGHDFCGSTLLSRLFAAVPAVASGGELRWLITDPGQRGRCSVCVDGDCEIFTQDFIAKLRPQNMYQLVGARFGKEILVSSDKGYMHYERFVAKKRMVGIILFRSPEGIVSSDKKHLKQWPFVRRDTVRKSLDEWLAVYMKLLAWTPAFCRDYVVLSYERLADDHVGVMTRLCERLGVPLEGEFPGGPMIEGYHNVLGNPSAHHSDVVFPDESWKERLSQKDLKFIQDDTRVQELHKRLKTMSLG